MATEVGRHAFAVLKEFHRLVRQPHVELLVDELMRRAVKVFVHRHVIVNVDLGLGPVGQFEGGGGQRQQLALFQHLKPTVARALQFLKLLGIELVQQRSDGLVEFGHAEEALVAQGRQDLPFGDLNPRLDLGFVARFSYARR